MLKRLKRKKDLARERRLIRKELVHAAGCVFDCVSKIVACDPQSRSEIQAVGVRFPRSLRRPTLTAPVPENIHLHLTPEEYEDLSVTMTRISKSDYEAESPETRARLDYACRPWDDTRTTHSVHVDDLFRPEENP